jgi:N-acetylmuramoyl-L-alanine amidase
MAVPRSFLLRRQPSARELGTQPSHATLGTQARHGGSAFGILLVVRTVFSYFARRAFLPRVPQHFWGPSLAGALLLITALLLWQFSFLAHAARPSSQAAQTPAPAAASASGSASPSRPPLNSFPTNLQNNVLNTVVLDAAHGGTDPGARGTGGIRESEVVLQFAAHIRRALETQGFQVVQTRLADEDPSFDDRSAMANAQRGAVFVTVHISSTGLAGTARVYVNQDLPAVNDPTGLLPWDQAQAPFLGLSRKLGDIVQGLLAQKFKGSPDSAQTAAVRQLRTTAAPAIAVEISSVSVEKREDLDRMAPGVAEAIARGIVAFKPSYVVASTATPSAPAITSAAQPGPGAPR